LHLIQSFLKAGVMEDGLASAAAEGVSQGGPLSPMLSGDRYVQMVKDGTLEAYPQMTVGKAFDGFLSNPKWESGLSDDNVRFVNVTGGALYFDEEAEFAVQSIIVDEKDGSFQYNACEVDGTPQSNLVFWGLLETIYGDSASTGVAESNKSLALNFGEGFVNAVISYVLRPDGVTIGSDTPLRTVRRSYSQRFDF